MSERFYDFVRDRAIPIYRSMTHAQVLGLDHVPGQGGFILASTHSSYFDVMCLVKETPRRIRWVTLTEIAVRPILGRFVLGMNAIPVERRATGSATLRKLITVLRAGEVLGIFPEAAIRPIEDSVLTGGRFKSGVIRMALMARVPIVPVAVLGGERFSSPLAWLPCARTPYTVAFGKALIPTPDVADPEENLRIQLAAAWRTLYEQMQHAGKHTKHQ